MPALRHQPTHHLPTTGQTQSASVIYNTCTSSNHTNNPTTASADNFDSDSMYLSDSSDSDISAIGAVPDVPIVTSVRVRVSTVVHFLILTKTV
jgi:hypothetical protein